MNVKKSWSLGFRLLIQTSFIPQSFNWELCRVKSFVQKKMSGVSRLEIEFQDLKLIFESSNSISVYNLKSVHLFCIILLKEKRLTYTLRWRGQFHSSCGNKHRFSKLGSAASLQSGMKSSCGTGWCWGLLG